MKAIDASGPVAPDGPPGRAPGEGRGDGRPPVADVRVRPMRRRHLRRVLAIERRVYPKPWSPGVFESELARTDDRRYVVAVGRDRGPGRLLPSPRRVFGYAGVLVRVGEAHVTTVAVDPAHHRRKVATHLLIALMNAARELGAEAATLEARVANRGAHRLYAGFGFTQVGVRPGYYTETNEDALIMWAQDLQSPAYARLLDEQRSRVRLPGGTSGAPDLHVPWVRGRVGLAGPSSAGPSSAGPQPNRQPDGAQPGGA